jgi:hypothetical protein
MRKYFTLYINADKKKDVPKLLSIIRTTLLQIIQERHTPIIAVTKNAHIVSGNLVIDIPLVRKFYNCNHVVQ